MHLKTVNAGETSKVKNVYKIFHDDEWYANDRCTCIELNVTVIEPGHAAHVFSWLFLYR